MKTIRITDGITFGLRKGGIVTSVTKSDGWFEVPEKTADTLCKAGHAELFDVKPQDVEQKGAFVACEDNSEDKNENASESDFEAMTFDELGELLRELGIFNKALKSKNARIEALKEYYASESTEDAGDFVV